MTKTVAVISGGMDSVTLAYYLADIGHDLHLISFNYGQRHKKELDFARKAADALGAPHDIVDLSNISALISRSALTSDRPVPDGHYAEDTMRQTVVPNRNAIMLNIAAGLAITVEAHNIATGVHAGDHYIYPDCRPEFVETIDAMLKVANEGFCHPQFSVLAPFVNITKGDICGIGHRLNVPWLDTWSCYKGGETHCGSCGTCFERREAFAEAGVEDPTPYLATPHYDDPRKAS